MPSFNNEVFSHLLQETIFFDKSTHKLVINSMNKQIMIINILIVLF